MRTVDLTPTWTEIVPALVAILSSNPHNELALRQLYNMAKLADLQADYLKRKEAQNDRG